MAYPAERSAGDKLGVDIHLRHHGKLTESNRCDGPPAEDHSGCRHGTAQQSNRLPVHRQDQRSGTGKLQSDVNDGTIDHGRTPA